MTMKNLIAPLALVFSVSSLLAAPVWTDPAKAAAENPDFKIQGEYVADGRAARRFGTASSRGMLFDHVTDFIFVTSALAGLAYAGLIGSLPPFFIVVAFSQYVLDSYFLFRQKSLKMSFLGRWNGVFYFFPLVLFSLAALEVLPTTLSEIISTGGKLLVWGLTLSTLASIADRAIAPLRE